MCPAKNTTPHNTPITIRVLLSWNREGPTIVIDLSCPDCGWNAVKEISLLKMMEQDALCPIDTSKTGLPAS